MHSKNSDCIQSAFQTFEPILVGGPNVLIMLKTFEVYSKWKKIEWHSGSILTAFEAHFDQTSGSIWEALEKRSKYSDCILTAFLGRVPTTFELHCTANTSGMCKSHAYTSGMCKSHANTSGMWRSYKEKECRSSWNSLPNAARILKKTSLPAGFA